GWRDAVSTVRRGGTVIFFSGVSGSLELDAQRIHYDELTLRGVFHHTPQTVRAALSFLASGAYPWRALLTHEISLDGLPALVAAAHQVDGTYVRRPFAPHERELFAECNRSCRELLLQVALDAVHLQRRRLAHVVDDVAQDLREADLEHVLRLQLPDDERVAE